MSAPTCQSYARGWTDARRARPNLTDFCQLEPKHEGDHAGDHFTWTSHEHGQVLLRTLHALQARARARRRT